MTEARRARLDEESELLTFAVRHGAATLALGLGACGLAALGFVAGSAWLVASPAVLALVLSPLAALGAAWTVVGADAVGRERRRRRLAAERPGEPWLADHPWRPPRVSDRAGAQLLPLLARLALGLACGAPLSAGLWRVGETGAAVVLGVVTAAAVGIGIAYVGGRAARWLRHGTGTLELAPFPAAPGEALHATFYPGRRVTLAGPLRASLRFVAEEHEPGGVPGGAPDVDVVCYRLYEDRREVAPAYGVIDPAVGVSFTLAVPADAAERGWTNGLADRPARYWQVVVAAERPGPDLRSLFFVPIYAPERRRAPDADRPFTPSP